MAVVVLATAGCDSQRARPDVERLVSFYAPDIRIGGHVSDAARARYALRVNPYYGYRDTTYVGPDGVRDIGLRVNEYIDDGDPRVSRGARVIEVSFQLRDTQTVAAVRRRLVAALGAPREECRLVRAEGREPAARLHRLQWAGRGQGVVMGYTDWRPADTAVARSDAASLGARFPGFRYGWVSFALEPSIAATKLDVIPCWQSDDSVRNH